jgi:hypothetical protein
MSVLLEAIHIFNAIPNVSLMTFITNIEKSAQEFSWKQKRMQIAKEILSKKTNARGITISNFKFTIGSKQ